jgi:hypothetical protein
MWSFWHNYERLPSSRVENKACGARNGLAHSYRNIGINPINSYVSVQLASSNILLPFNIRYEWNISAAKSLYSELGGSKFLISLWGTGVIFVTLHNIYLYWLFLTCGSEKGTCHKNQTCDKVKQLLVFQRAKKWSNAVFQHAASKINIPC